ncbi:MAG: phenylalanine--tRNA ligase subunit beta [Algiphilus sp.]|uniref:phenylalanine--tRNA ligase subunit beta n=1 Tax=Algiphilus sp. TaxID=1872431 RepID=UPI0032EC24CF
MKVSKRWLLEFIDSAQSAEALAEGFTLAGLECEVEAAAPDRLLEQVVVGRIVAAAPHPDADRLQVCEVDVGEERPRTIVCGAANARPGLRTAVALPGARLPNGLHVQAQAVRGVESSGMLSSAQELGLAETSSGILELDAEAPVGTPLAEWLDLDDDILVFELTPDRGDALSVIGLAREAVALGLGQWRDGAELPSANAAHPDGDAGDSARPVAIDAPELCPRYMGRCIEGAHAREPSPDWLRERLRRSGVRSVSLVVDISNLVMLETGQPLHAFDDSRLQGTVRVRQAQPGESIRLLNDQSYTLAHGELVIADDTGPVALAGVMGGQHAEMRLDSETIFLESACFLPPAVAGTGRRHKLHSDAVHRFERGVDPAAVPRALERATQLILAMAGGAVKGTSNAGSPPVARAAIVLRRSRLTALLGIAIDDTRVTRILGDLGFVVDAVDAGWSVQAPSWRFDISREVDLIEEVARVVGFDAIGAESYAAHVAMQPVAEARLSDQGLRGQLVARGFQEVVSYSFVEQALDAALNPDAARIPVDNPIAAPFNCMRSTLWSSLLPIVRYNVDRQCRRSRLFELARRYSAEPGVHPTVREEVMLAGAMWGSAYAEHWAQPDRMVDFFDLKGELQSLIPGLEVSADAHPALHPGRSGQVTLAAHGAIGWMGQIHPSLAEQWDVPQSLLVFELAAEPLQQRRLPHAPHVPEYPASRRDLSLEVQEDVPAQALVDTALRRGPEMLRNCFVFDVYQGVGLKNGCKAIALGLIFQDFSRTLTDELIDEAAQSVVGALHDEWGARIRG